MRVWLVNPFDPLPGEKEQLGRYGVLANQLSAAGHDVVWWSSDFSHRFKRHVDSDRIHRAADEWGITVRLIGTSPYEKNVSLRRMRSHRAFGRRFEAEAAAEAPPDIILASSPPLESARAAARLGRKWSVPAVVDIQDQWPENFRGVLPAALKPFHRLLFHRLYHCEREAYGLAAGIVGVAQGYVNHGLDVGGEKADAEVFPLGVNLDALTAAMEAGAKDYQSKWSKQEGQIWMLYSGSLSHSYDFLTILRAAALAQEEFGSRVRFILTGTGELAGQGEALIKEHRLDNACMTGFLEFTEWAYLLSQVDVGFNASFPGSMIYLPNKIFSYLAAGAAVLNTIHGECGALVEDSGCGLNYEAGDVESCFAAVRSLVDSPRQLAEMKSASHRLAHERFDQKIIAKEMVAFLEQVAAERETGGPA